MITKTQDSAPPGARFHPASQLFQMLPAEKLADLAEDIRQHGQREPIWLHRDGLIIDGRNRWMACRKAGVEPKTQVFQGTDEEILPFVLSLNLHRRHLDESQRAMVAARIKSLNLDSTAEQASQVMNVSRAATFQAQRVQDSGTPELAAAVDAGKIPVSVAAKIASAPPETQKAIVEHVDRGAKPAEAARQVRRESLAGRAVALPKGKHRVIYTDPPWQYSDSRGGLDDYGSTAAETHYPTMSVEQLCALDVKALAADDAVLFCWATFPLLPDALAVVKAWGFTYKTAIVWDKDRSNVGNYHNASAELLLICTRGSGTPETDVRPDQVQHVPHPGRHSAKPEEFREMIDAMYPSGPRIELFRRGEAPDGWAVWGNEAGAA